MLTLPFRSRLEHRITLDEISITGHFCSMNFKPNTFTADAQCSDGTTIGTFWIEHNGVPSENARFELYYVPHVGKWTGNRFYGSAQSAEECAALLAPEARIGLRWETLQEHLPGLALQEGIEKLETRGAWIGCGPVGA